MGRLCFKRDLKTIANGSRAYRYGDLWVYRVVDGVLSYFFRDFILINHLHLEDQATKRTRPFRPPAEVETSRSRHLPGKPSISPHEAAAQLFPAAKLAIEERSGEAKRSWGVGGGVVWSDFLVVSSGFLMALYGF